MIPSFHQGGSERQALQLSQLLQGDGTYDVRLACLQKAGVLLDDDVINAFGQIVDFPLNSFYDRNFVGQVRRLVRWLRENEIEIVQTHDFYTNIFGMISARLASVPVRIAAKRETGMRTWAQRTVERRAFGFASSVVVNSEGVRNYLAKAGVPAKKLKLIYNGIEAGRFDRPFADRRAILSSLGLDPERPGQLVTIVANLREKVKNHEMFLRAAHNIAERIPDAGFVVAGEGDRSDELKRFASELGLRDRVYFIGRCSCVPELLSISDVCVLTSDSEGFSNAILEYTASGKPVVATNVGGAAEAIIQGETGYLVEPNDDRAMSERVCQILEDADLAERFGRAGKRRVLSLFSTTTQLQATLELYDAQLRRRGRPRP